MIKGRCRTNLDDYRQYSWPTLFVAVPREGERVESNNGISLKVVGVTHSILESQTSCESGEENVIKHPFIIVELNK